MNRLFTVLSLTGVGGGAWASVRTRIPVTFILTRSQADLKLKVVPISRLMVRITILASWAISPLEWEEHQFPHFVQENLKLEVFTNEKSVEHP